jgi:hypothetical protein
MILRIKTEFMGAPAFISRSPFVIRFAAACGIWKTDRRVAFRNSISMGRILYLLEKKPVANLERAGVLLENE